MKKLIYIPIILAVLIFSSCATISTFNPGTSNPIKDNFEVVGNVQKEFTDNVVLGLFSFGNYYLDALEQLKEEVEADDIINIYVEEKHNIYFLGIYIQKRFIVKGTAINYI